MLPEVVVQYPASASHVANPTANAGRWPDARMFSPGPSPASYMPVVQPSLVGAHTGDVVKKRRYRTPSAASRSMWGVRASGLP